MVYKIHMTNNFLMLILPAIAAPTVVFFMRQYMIPSLSLEMIQAARIDGAKEFLIFNKIALPIMKPAIATQAIFAFVSSWNNLFTPLVLLTDNSRFLKSMSDHLSPSNSDDRSPVFRSSTTTAPSR